MNLIEALKAAAPAVGDGRLVPTSAYVLYRHPFLKATDGAQWATVRVDGPAYDPFCVRHDAFLRALDREGSTLRVDGQNVRIQCGRSRITLRGIDPDDWPEIGGVNARNTFRPPDYFNDLLRGLSEFCGGGDAHTWQQGVHFRERFAFAANPFGLARFDYAWPSVFRFSIPPWATKFILAQDESPRAINDNDQTLSFVWDDFVLDTTILNENPSDAIINFVSEIVRTDLFVVPPNLQESVERVKAYGERQFSLGEGVLERITEHVEIVDDVDIETEKKIWGVDTMLNALKLAEFLDLTGTNALWSGHGYIGVFSGITR